MRGRVVRLEQLRRERAARRERIGRVNLQVDAGERSGKLVAELEDVSLRYGERTVIDGLSARIMRGDRVGLIGANGAGKSTLIRLILGTQQPDSGTVRLGTNLNIAYFDQIARRIGPGTYGGGYHQSGIRLGGNRGPAQTHHQLPAGLPVLRHDARSHRYACCPAASATACCWQDCSPDPRICWSWTNDQ